MNDMNLTPARREVMKAFLAAMEKNSDGCSSETVTEHRSSITGRGAYGGTTKVLFWMRRQGLIEFTSAASGRGYVASPQKRNEIARLLG